MVVDMMTGDIIDMCRPGNDADGEAKQLMAAMSLYSHNTSAVVLLVDTRINSYTGIKRSFKEVCEQVPEKSTIPNPNPTHCEKSTIPDPLHNVRVHYLTLIVN